MTRTIPVPYVVNNRISVNYLKQEHSKDWMATPTMYTYYVMIM